MFGMSSAALAKRLREAITIEFEKAPEGAVMIVKWGRHEIIRKTIERGVFE